MTTTSSAPARVAGALALVASLGAPVAAQEVAYSGGLQVVSGTYLFETRTNSVYLLSGVDVTTGALRLAASIPVIVQNTPWIAYGPVPLPSGGRQAGEVDRQTRRGHRRIVLPDVASETHAGFGDPLLHAQAELVRDAGSRPSLRIGASAKAPVASTANGLSTGAWDVGTGLSLSKQAGVHLLSADVSYWHFGDMVDLPLENAWSYAASYGRVVLSGRWSMLLSASGYTRIIEGQDPPVQIGVGIGRVFSPRRTLSGNLSIGLTNTAPDVSVGLGWRLGL